MSTCTKILLEGTLPISSNIIGSAVMQSPHQSEKLSLVLFIQIILDKYWYNHTFLLKSKHRSYRVRLLKSDVARHRTLSEDSITRLYYQMYSIL